MQALLRILALVLVFCFASTTDAQSKQEGDDRVLMSADGWPIHVTYFQSKNGKESPVAILAAAAEGPESSRTRKVWNGVAVALNKAGYAVVTVDLRKHGDSMPEVDEAQAARLRKVTSRDYTAMIADMETVKKFLVGEHEREKLNIRKLGIATAGSSGLVAAGFAALDWAKRPWPDNAVVALRTPKGQDVRALVLLSPKSSVKGIQAGAVLKTVADPLKGIAINVYFDPADRNDVKASETIYRYIKLRKVDDPDARKTIKSEPGQTGERILVSSKKQIIEQEILKFFNKYVDGRTEPWKSRRSPLQN